MMRQYVDVKYTCKIFIEAYYGKAGVCVPNFGIYCVHILLATVSAACLFLSTQLMSTNVSRPRPVIQLWSRWKHAGGLPAYMASDV
jgi:hypothetical protein